jgi:hypothetical protein
MNKKNTNIDEVGNSLIQHVRGAAATRPGIVEEIFPHIVQASKKISARAIAKFLDEKHGVKVSYVTVGRALRNPAKYWNRYYDSIEEHAWIVAEWFDKTVLDFISEPEKYQEMLEGLPVLGADVTSDQDTFFHAQNAFENARSVLDEKWFCFDEDVLEEARFHLLQRMTKKPAIQIEEPDENQD